MFLKRIASAFGLICSAVTIVAGIGIVYQPEKWLPGLALLLVGMLAFSLIVADFYLNKPMKEATKPKPKKK